MHAGRIWLRTGAGKCGFGDRAWGEYLESASAVQSFSGSLHSASVPFASSGSFAVGRDDRMPRAPSFRCFAERAMRDLLRCRLVPGTASIEPASLKMLDLMYRN